MVFTTWRMSRNLLMLAAIGLSALSTSFVVWLLCRKKHRDFALWSGNEGLLIVLFMVVALIGLSVHLGWIEMKPD